MQRKFRHPGQAFLSQVDLLEPPRHLEPVFAEYADFLRTESGIGKSESCDLEIIFDQFGLQHIAHPLEEAQDGFVYPEQGVIFTNSNQIMARQTFSRAHELMEYLVNALCDKSPDWAQLLKDPSSGENRSKERLCDSGASELLMPKAFCIEYLEHHSGLVTLSMARDWSDRMGVSLMAAICRCINFSNVATCFTSWQLAHKPSELGRINQHQLMFGDDFESRPKKKLRVQNSFSNREFFRSVFPKDKSVDEDSLILKAWDARVYLSGEEPMCYKESRWIAEVEADILSNEGVQYCYVLHRIPSDLAPNS